MVLEFNAPLNRILEGNKSKFGFENVRIELLIDVQSFRDPDR